MVNDKARIHPLLLILFLMTVWVALAWKKTLGLSRCECVYVCRWVCTHVEMNVNVCHFALAGEIKGGSQSYAKQKGKQTRELGQVT